MAAITAGIVAMLLHHSASSTRSPGEIIRGVVTGDGSGSEWADGALPDGVTVFDDEYPGIAALDPELLQVLRDAAADASQDGVEFTVNSGWRSAAYQEQLFREAVDRYGSAEEASRWVASVDSSAHVSGHAVDLGPLDTTTWLSEHGASYGLCQIYANEPWHYELRPEAVTEGCPSMYLDATHGPMLRH